MSARRQIHAAIFDMDGLLIDSEPLWDKAELEVMASLGVDISRRHEMPDILGLRIDLVVDLWFAQQPWKGPDRAEVTARIINRAIQLVEEARPLLPGAREAVAMCKAQGLKIGLASASPLHPQVYLDCAARLSVSPMHCVALEDSVNGMIASKAARMRSIVVPEAENSRDPRFVLADVKLATLESLTLSDLLG